jgi:hypothetical protein
MGVVFHGRRPKPVDAPAAVPLAPDARGAEMSAHIVETGIPKREPWVLELHVVEGANESVFRYSLTRE